MDGDDPEFKGLQTFIIEKERGKLPEGCYRFAPIPKIGYFGWNTFELAFDGCRIPRRTSSPVAPATASRTRSTG